VLADENQHCTSADFADNLTLSLTLQHAAPTSPLRYFSGLANRSIGLAVMFPAL
jgi:hypothetical protein